MFINQVLRFQKFSTYGFCYDLQPKAKVRYRQTIGYEGKLQWLQFNTDRIMLLMLSWVWSQIDFSLDQNNDTPIQLSFQSSAQWWYLFRCGFQCCAMADIFLPTKYGPMGSTTYQGALFNYIDKRRWVSSQPKKNTFFNPYKVETVGGQVVKKCKNWST